MQPVAELAFFDITDEPVDTGDCLGRRTGQIQTQIVLDPHGLRLGADIVDCSRSRRRGSSPSALENSSSRAPAAPSDPVSRLLPQGRRDMAKRHRPDASFGLCCFAGVVDDERVDDRQIANQRFGPTRIAKGHRLAGQPFERAMRTDMDQGIGLLLQPEVKGDIGMARHAFEIVIVVVARAGLPALGLQGDQAFPRRTAAKLRHPSRVRDRLRGAQAGADPHAAAAADGPAPPCRPSSGQ